MIVHPFPSYKHSVFRNISSFNHGRGLENWFEFRFESKVLKILLLKIVKPFSSGIPFASLQTYFKLRWMEHFISVAKHVTKFWQEEHGSTRTFHSQNKIHKQQQQHYQQQQ